MTDLRVEPITNDLGLERLAPEWSALCASSPTSTPFQRPEWLLPARRHLSGGATPYTCAVRRGDDLVAVMPLERSGAVLRWIGAGVSDYLDLIAEPGTEQAALAAIFAHLSEVFASWQSLELDALRAGSPVVSQSLPNGFRDVVVHAEPSPVAALPLGSSPAKLPYYRRRLARLRGVTWRMAGEADATELVRALVRLHGARWGTRGGGVLADAAVQQFHGEVCSGMARRRLLRLFALELDGHIAAVFYGFAQHGRYHYYLSGFDPELARLSPGTVIIDHAIRQATAEGASEFDFLRGRESYKYGWGALDRPAFLRRIWHG